MAGADEEQAVIVFVLQLCRHSGRRPVGSKMYRASRRVKQVLSGAPEAVAVLFTTAFGIY